jgi:hypothetical protein
MYFTFIYTLCILWMRRVKKCLMPTLNAGESGGLEGVEEWRAEGLEGWREWRAGGPPGNRSANNAAEVAASPLFWANRTQQVSRCQQKELPRLFSTKETR